MNTINKIKDNMKLNNICCACLSLERKLSPLNYVNKSAKNLFLLLTNNSETHQEMSKDTARYYICWECQALLRRFGSFRQQVCDAQQQLIDLLADKHDPSIKIDCLSKLSYNYKRFFDIEIIYSDVLNKDDTLDDEPGFDIDIDIKGDYSEPEIKIETEHKEIDEDSNKNPFIEVNYAVAIKEENENTKNDFVVKREVKIKDGGEESCSEEEIKPKRRVLKRKVNDTVKPKTTDGAKVKKKNVKREKHFHEGKKNVTNQGQKATKAPKTKTTPPRKVQKPKEDSDFPCAECDQVFTTYTGRYEHVLKYHKEGYQCVTCGKKYHIKKSFLKHERMHIAKTLPPEKCKICGKMVRCDLVETHAQRHASKDTATYECVPCNKQFANKNSYKKHMTETQTHLPRVEKKFECETCNKTFPTQMLYNCHMRYTKTHAGQDSVFKHKCSMCEKSFKYPAALRDHVNYVHMGKTQHKCTVCDKALAYRQCVNRHMKLFHGGYKHPKNKLCVTCGKAFSTTKELREHESVHTGERPLKCDVCGDTFRHSGALYTHKRRVHKVPLKPSVALVFEPDETVERLVRSCELTESELVIKRAEKD